jgi:fatty acid desaturase
MVAEATTSGERPDGDGRDMGTAGLQGRNALEIGTLRSLSLRSDAQGVVRFAIHVAVMLGTGYLVWRSLPHWYLLIPAAVLHGFTIVTMFAPMHECVHRTPFVTPLLNEIFGWIAGLLSFYNFHFYRQYHTWHHRYTQDPERDPELNPPKATSVAGYFIDVSGFNWWKGRPWLFLKLSLGKLQDYPYVPESGRRKVQISAAAQTAVYVAALVSIACGYLYAWWFFFLPALLAQPFLRCFTIAEHTGCTYDENGLTNTRTTLASFPVRLLMWNMPYHAEHHLYPSIPFHRLPQAHQELKQKLRHVEPGYIASNCAVVRSLGVQPVSHEQVGSPGATQS